MTAPTPDAALAYGYIVLIREHDRWTDTWDGEVHASADQGERSLGEARKAGYTAVLTAAIPVAGHRPDAAAVPTC